MYALAVGPLVLLYGLKLIRRKLLTLRAMDPAPVVVRLVSGFITSYKLTEEEFYAADGAPPARE